MMVIKMRIMQTSKQEEGRKLEVRTPSSIKYGPAVSQEWRMEKVTVHKSQIGKGGERFCLWQL